MGWFFNLFVETGKNQKGIDKLTNYFLSVETITTQFGTHKLDIYPDSIGITISVRETGWSALSGLGEKEIATEVGYEFYKLLKNAPRFRYAMVGVEAGEWVEEQDILDEDFDGYLPEHGLVLNNELPTVTEKTLVPFKSGYSWIPYKGEIENA